MSSKPLSRPKPPNVQEAVAVIAAARARGRGRRSPLYLWFADHYVELAAAFARNSPAWVELAAYLGERGLRDADGKIPTARGTRDAWYRVGKDQAAAMAKKSTAQPPPAVRVSPVVPKPLLEPQTDAPEAGSPQPHSADVQEILGRLGGSRTRGNRLPRSVE